MRDNNKKLKWIKPFLQLFIFSLLTSTVCADNSTEYTNSTDYTDSTDGDLETFLVIQPAPEFIPECGVNEVYQPCEVDCIDCERRGVCEPQNCHIKHCDCRMTFVRLTPGGQCDHVSKCPARECPENEVYRPCGPYCEPCDLMPCRKMDCTSRCFCISGYRRNRETGKCVPENECPERVTCIANDAVAQNGSASEYCLSTESEAQRVNETIEDEKCFCPTGFKRNLHGWCIEEELCSYVSCYGDTTFQDCPRKCNTTCWNYGDPKCEEDGQCYPSCFCPEGFVLNEYFVCIRWELCPPGSNPFVPTLPPPTAIPIVEPSTAATTESYSGSSENGSISATTAESSSGTGSSSAAEADSSTGSKSSSDVAEGTEKAKEAEPEAPKKPPKKAIRAKMYKSAARPGKTATAEEE